MGRVLRDGLRADVPVWRQFGPNDVRRVGVPCLVGVSVDVDGLIAKLGEKALKSKGKRATAFYGALVLEVKQLASGIEAATADETRSGSAEGESPAPEGGDAQ